MRKDKLVSGEIYHVFSRSIAEYIIFNNREEYGRMRKLIRYYQREKPELKFSQYQQLSRLREISVHKANLKDKNDIVQIIAYCLMPTHIHLVLKQLTENGISSYMANVLNSYSRYFNIKHGRKGPLWEGKFKNVLVNKDSQLAHLTRYVHLNPATAGLVKKAQAWQMSSYNEYLGMEESEKVCEYTDLLDMSQDTYKEFVEDRAGYQKELAMIKALLLD